MKKWADMARSRAGNFSLANALRAAGLGDGQNELAVNEDRVPVAAKTDSEEPLESSTPKRSVMENQGDSELEAKVKEGSFKVEQLEKENAELKATIEELKKGVPKTETKDGNKPGAQQGATYPYDPLGASNNNEILQLRRQLSTLMEECESYKNRIRELEQEFADVDSLKKELHAKTDGLESMEAKADDLKSQLRAVKDEFQRFRRQSESNAEEYEHKMETLSGQLGQQLKSGKHSHSRSFLESFPEHCDLPFHLQSPLIQSGGSLDDTYSTDIDGSLGMDPATEELDEVRKKSFHLAQSLRAMAIKQKDLQRRFMETQDERDYLKSVMEDLQKQVDASSPETTAHLRAMIQDMQKEIRDLSRENELLQFRIQNEPLAIMEEESETFSEDDYQGGPRLRLRSAFAEFGGRKLQESHSEISEELVDCSMDIMGELANATADVEIGISMTYVQYAGLIAAIQKAVKQLEASKQSSESMQSFHLLEKTLSQTLSISRFRVHRVGNDGEKRLDELMLSIKEKESGLKFMEQMITDLRIEIKGHSSLTLQQEVQLEYLKQQLSGPDKVISLTMEIESLKKRLEDCQRELKAQRDLNDQQQQELTIQWQSKQLAVAENLSQTHRVSSFSQQLEHVVEANEALEAEKMEMEEELVEVREEREQLAQQYNQKCAELYEEIDQLKKRLNESNAHSAAPLQSHVQPASPVRAHAHSKALSSSEECQEILEMLKDVNDSLFAAQSWVNEELIEQRSKWIQHLTGIEIDCAAWRVQTARLEKENADLKEALDVAKEKCVVAEKLKERAEQEKTGLQEILSLTSEATSKDIANLQSQLSEANEQLGRERLASKEANETFEEKSQEFQKSIDALQTTLKDERAQKKKEVDALTAELLSFKKEVTNLTTRTQSYNEVISGLNRDLALYEGKLKDSNKSLEECSIACGLEREKVAVFERRVVDMSRTLELKEEENKKLLKRCSELESVEIEMHEIVEEKTNLETDLEESLKRHEELQQSQHDLQSQMEDVTEKWQSLKKECRRLESQILEEREGFQKERLNWEMEITALSDMDIPREQWPESIRLLVASCEHQALEKTKLENEARMEEMEIELQKKDAQAKEMEESLEGQLFESEEEVRLLNDKIENLLNEMKERETKFQSEIESIQSKSEEKIKDLSRKLSKKTEQYDTFKEESETTIKDLEEELELKELELTEVQAKAREMMKAKDEEIQSLRKEIKPSLLNRSLPDDVESSSEERIVQKLESDVTLLRKQVSHLSASLEDSEHTHELRNKADQVLKEELSELERSRRREGLDMDYVKNVLVNAFEQGTLPKSSPMLIVLARLFEFSSQEMERIKSSQIATSPTKSSSTRSSLFSGWSR